MSPWRRMIPAIFARSGGPPAVAFEDSGCLAKILRTKSGRRDEAERLHVLAAVVVESVNSAARNAERLSPPDVDGGPAAHLAAHLEDVARAHDDWRADRPDFPASTQGELHALSLCAVKSGNSWPT